MKRVNPKKNSLKVKNWMTHIVIEAFQIYIHRGSTKTSAPRKGNKDAMRPTCMLTNVIGSTPEEGGTTSS